MSSGPSRVGAEIGGAQVAVTWGHASEDRAHLQIFFANVDSSPQTQDAARAWRPAPQGRSAGAVRQRPSLSVPANRQGGLESLR